MLRIEAEDAHFLEEEADAAVGGEMPPPLVMMLRTPATVRVGLSVAVSTSNATP